MDKIVPQLTFNDVHHVLEKEETQRTRAELILLSEFLKIFPSLRNMCTKIELDSHLAELSQFIELEILKEGQAVFHKGEQSTHFYLVIEGSVAVFIAKSLQELELEEKWKTSLVSLSQELVRLQSLQDSRIKLQLNPIDLDKEGKKQLQQQIQDGQNQIESLKMEITQGKSILRCLRNIEDEEILRKLNEAKYFKGDQAQICTFKNVQVFKEKESFGESVLSVTSQQRTATVVAYEESSPGRGVVLGKVKKNQFLSVFQNELEKRSAIRTALVESYKNDISDKVLNTLTFQFKEYHLEKDTFVAKQLHGPINISPDQNPFLNKNQFSSTKQNLKEKTVKEEIDQQNQQESLIQSQEIDSTKEDKSTQNFFKKQQDTPNNAGDNSPTRRRAREQLIEMLEQQENLYFLYKGSLDVKMIIKDNDVQEEQEQKYINRQKEEQQMATFQNDLLKQRKMRIPKKMNLLLTRLTEGEFFGHENWYKEDTEKMLRNYGISHTPEEALKERIIQLKKDFSLIVSEIDTAVFKIPRKFLMEEQNQQLYRSLVSHGKMKHDRYTFLATQQVLKERSEKKDLRSVEQAPAPISILNVDQKLSRRAFINIEKQAQQKRSSSQTRNQNTPKSPLKTQNQAIDSGSFTALAASIVKTQQFKDQFNLFRNKFDASYNFSVSQFKKGGDPASTEAGFKQQQLEKQQQSSVMQSNYSKNLLSPEKLLRLQSSSSSTMLIPQKSINLISEESRNSQSQAASPRKLDSSNKKNEFFHNEQLSGSMQLKFNTDQEEDTNTITFSSKQSDELNKNKYNLYDLKQFKSISLHESSNIKKDAREYWAKKLSIKNNDANTLRKTDSEQVYKTKESLNEEQLQSVESYQQYKSQQSTRTKRLLSLKIKNYLSNGQEHESMSPILIKSIPKPQSAQIRIPIQQELIQSLLIDRGDNTSRQQQNRSPLISLNKVLETEEDFDILSQQELMFSQELKSKLLHEQSVKQFKSFERNNQIPLNKDYFNREIKSEPIQYKGLTNYSMKGSSSASKELLSHLQQFCLTPSQSKYFSKSLQLQSNTPKFPQRRLHSKNSQEESPQISPRKEKPEIKPHNTSSPLSESRVRQKKLFLVQGNSAVGSFSSLSYRDIKEGYQSGLLSTDMDFNNSKTITLTTAPQEKYDRTSYSQERSKEDFNGYRSSVIYSSLDGKNNSMSLETKQKKEKSIAERSHQKQSYAIQDFYSQSKNIMNMKKAKFTKTIQSQTDQSDVIQISATQQPLHLIQNCFKKK